MSSGLSKVGVIWALTSFLSAAAASVGFYLPFWLQGWMRDERVTPVYFGVFRRCNYPKLMETGLIKVVEECGRYTTFHDIPSTSWRIAAVLVGVGCGIAILVSFTALLAMCIKDIFSETAVRVAGVVQLFAGKRHELFMKGKLKPENNKLLGYALFLCHVYFLTTD